MNLSALDVQNIYNDLHVLGSGVDQVNFIRGEGSVGFRQRSAGNMRGRRKKKSRWQKLRYKLCKPTFVSSADRPVMYDRSVRSNAGDGGKTEADKIFLLTEK